MSEILVNNIPVEVIKAAQTLDEYFLRAGHYEWELLNVCSRRSLDKAKTENRILQERVKTQTKVGNMHQEQIQKLTLELNDLKQTTQDQG